MSLKGKLGEWWRWHSYYNGTRRLRMIPPWIARRSPRWLQYWTLIAVGSRFGVGPDEISLTRMLKLVERP